MHNPWYANLVNFMVTGTYLQKKIRRRYTATDFTFGMTPIYSRSVLIVYFDAMFHCVRQKKSSNVRIRQPTEHTMECYVPMLRFGKVDYHVWRCQGIRMLSQMPETQEYKCPFQYAIAIQSIVGYFRRMGDWIHWSIPNIWAVWVHLDGHGLCVKVCGSTLLCCGQFEELEEYVPRDHISTLRSTTSHD